MKTKSIVVAAVIAIGVVAVPLWIKSNQPSKSAPSSASATQVRKPRPSGQALPKFVDLGTTTCAPCKVMLGVMAELEQTYPGAMEIEFVNVQQDRAGAQRYGIKIIPTQIFFAPDGRELFRHVGVFRTEEVIAKWAELGYPMQPSRER